jgi:hypothetical protein
VLNAKKLRPLMVRVLRGGRDVYYFIIADPVCELPFVLRVREKEK